MSGNDDAASGGARCGQCSRKLRPPIQRIGALAGLVFDVLADERQALGGCEFCDMGSLCLDAEAGSLLPPGGNPQVGNRALHVQTAYHRMRTGRSAKSSNVIISLRPHQTLV